MNTTERTEDEQNRLYWQTVARHPVYMERNGQRRLVRAEAIERMEDAGWRLSE